MTKEQDKIKDFLRNIPPGSHQAYAMMIGKTTCTITGGACHSGFKEVSSCTALGSGFCPNKDQEALGHKFWAWITGDTSPWRKLMINGIIQVFGPDNLQRGFLFPEETIRTLPFNFIKNFCILCRIFTEKHEQIKIWEKLVDKGMEPSDAFILCGYINKMLTTDKYSDAVTTHLSGAHWPLTEGIAYYSRQVKLDFKAFRTGEAHLGPNKRITPYHGSYESSSDYEFELINGFFQERKPSKRSSFSVSEYGNLGKQKGRFSSSKFYDLDQIIDGFYRWQKQEGLRD